MFCFVLFCFFVDENECTDTSLCGNGACVNEVGAAYTCNCESGYVGTGTQMCSGKVYQSELIKGEGNPRNSLNCTKTGKSKKLINENLRKNE